MIAAIRDETGKIISDVEFYNSRAYEGSTRYKAGNNNQDPIYHTEAKLLQDLVGGYFGETDGKGIVHMIGYNPNCSNCITKISLFIQGKWRPRYNESPIPVPSKYQFTNFQYWALKNDTVKSTW